MARDLRVRIGAAEFVNPVFSASGTFGYGKEYAELTDLRNLGAIITKGISLLPRQGNPPPRIVETAAGMLNAIGLENVGFHAFARDKMPFLRQCGTKVIVNILGDCLEDYQNLAASLHLIEGISALEVNISCPNVKKGGAAFGTDPAMAAAVTKGVRAETALPIIVKLTPNVTDIAEIAMAVEEGGADGISLINTLLGMAIDVKTRRPRLGNVFGGLSGPAIKPVALRMVYQVAKKVHIPVIGIGGITSAEDALEFILAGASAIQVGTANFINPQATTDILAGIEGYMVENNVSTIQDIIGRVEA